MSDSRTPTHTAELLDERVELTLGELCRVCEVHAEVIIAMVDEGVIEPCGTNSNQWRFPGPALRRVEIALRLERDLGVNLPGVALAVDLLEEIEQLRARLWALDEHEREGY